MLGMAGHTEFDVHFRIFGFHVRIHPLFWVMAAFVIWGSTNDPVEKFLGVFCVLLSILVHELGHATFIRKWGIDSEIVLHGMGGYATSGHFSTWKSVWISFAGPLAGFILYGLLWGIIMILLKVAPDVLTSEPLLYVLDLLLWINLWWGIMNLAPVIPLDGGRIVEALMARYAGRRGTEWTLQISIVTAGGIAFCAYQYWHDRFLLILFGILCAQSVITYNEYKGRY